MGRDIREQNGVAIVEMGSNSVNRQNPGFFSDLDDALDRLERDFAFLFRPVALAVGKSGAVC